MDILTAVRTVEKNTAKAFKRPSWESAVYFDEDDSILRWESSDEPVDMTPSRLNATDYTVIDRDGVGELTAYYDSDLNRWRSTTNPSAHKAKGRKVATFVLDTPIG